MRPGFTSLLGNLWFKSLCVWVFDTYPHDPTGIIYARQSYLGATSPKNCGAKMLDCNHFVIFNLCLYGNSLNQTPISPRLETITSLASALPGRPTVKTSITTQNSDAVRSTTEVLRTAFCLLTIWHGRFMWLARAAGLPAGACHSPGGHRRSAAKVVGGSIGAA